jgi:general secretion pathway protein G
MATTEQTNLSKQVVKHRAGRGGFSLMELMVVIVIIGLLAGTVTISVRSYMTAALRNTAKMEIAKIAEALDMYYDNELKGYPPTGDGLAVLSKPTDKFPDAYLKGKLTDPWGNAYDYIVPGPGREPFEILCYGSDGKEGGTGGAKDISSLQLKD